MNIVCLGTKFETMNYRLQDTNAHFYQIYFDTVINQREQILGKADNETYINFDITNTEWTKQIDTSKPILIVASGVFLYFEQDVIGKQHYNLNQ